MYLETLVQLFLLRLLWYCHYGIPKIKKRLITNFCDIFVKRTCFDRIWINREFILRFIIIGRRSVVNELIWKRWKDMLWQWLELKYNEALNPYQRSKTKANGYTQRYDLQIQIPNTTCFHRWRNIIWKLKLKEIYITRPKKIIHAFLSIKLISPSRRMGLVW